MLKKWHFVVGAIIAIIIGISIGYYYTVPVPETTMEEKLQPRETVVDQEGNNTEDIEYDITGGKVLSITPNVNTRSLLISLETTGDGQLTVTLPLALVSALFSPSGRTDSLFVLVDREEISFDETKTDTDRTLIIPFNHGAKTIEIIGMSYFP